MAGPGNILIRVGADASAAVRELRGLGGPLSDVQTRGEKMGAAVRRAAVPAAATLVALGAAGLSAAKAAAEDQAAQVKLAGALERTTGATHGQVAAAEAFIDKLAVQVGVADDELRPALARLASATGDVGTAQDRLKLALDISAQSGKSLDVVTKALASAEDGRTLALGKLVPGLDQATLKSKDMTAITAELAEKTGGAAAEAADTATGKYRVMQVQMGELQETLGAALLPVIGALVEILSKATEFAAAHTTAAKAVVAVVAALAAGILILNVALKAYAVVQAAVKVATTVWTAAQWLLNVALDANPIGIVILAVAALVAGVVIAYRRSETFRDILNGLWDVIRNSPLGILISHFDDLVDVVKDAVDWIKKIHFPDVISDKFGGLLDLVERLVDWIERIDFPSPPGWLSHVPGFGAGPSSAPAAAARALSAGDNATRSAAPRSLGPAGSGISSLAAGGIVVNVYGATDPEGAARAIRRTLRQFERRQGGLAAIATAGE